MKERRSREVKNHEQEKEIKGADRTKLSGPESQSEMIGKNGRRSFIKGDWMAINKIARLACD
jgi:hypothetical protein